MQIHVQQFAENVAIFLSFHYRAVGILICGQYYRKEGKFLSLLLLAWPMQRGLIILGWSVNWWGHAVLNKTEQYNHEQW